jgi:hypothetical protein
VPGKHFTFRRAKFFSENRCANVFCPEGLFLSAIVAGAMAFNSVAEDTVSTTVPKFLGSQTCSSSSCHGGADEKHNQYTIWSTHDFHHARPYATLETARSERLAEVLKIGNPTQSARCTVCHAPFQTVPAERLGPDAKVTEGISCESCHGPAENWIRSHTRPDYAHADRVASGMRDLKNIYVRANTCVACHQILDPEIRAAGHPELIFEMDGQCADMPRHWPKAEDKPGPQIWLVGQAAALREASWQSLQGNFSRNNPHEEESIAREDALFWLLQKTESIDASLPAPAFLQTKYTSRTIHEWSDDFAIKASAVNWTNTQTKKALSLLSASGDEMSGGSKVEQARKAERLVLALDRLTRGLSGMATNTAVNESLNRLFADAQSLPDFDAQQFAKDLNTFHSSVAGFLETK